MFVAIGLVYLWLRRAEALRAAPLVLAVVVAVHFVVPGALGTFKNLFFPAGGLWAEHSNVWVITDPELPTWCNFAGRTADLGPGLSEGMKRPFFGSGYGTRLALDDPTTGAKANACILDNQWLGTFLDMGFLGVIAFGWLLLRFIRRAGAVAKVADDDTSRLLTAFASSIAAFGIAMFLFDAFSFIQAMMIFFVLLALGASFLVKSQSGDFGPVPRNAGRAGASSAR
jgi:O-antigen ligase